MSDIAIKAVDLGKSYTILPGLSKSLSKQRTLQEDIAGFVKNPFSSKKRYKEEIWALQDVNFEIKKGEVVGIIGANGAGKSTLLKILSRITEPTTGHVDMYGRVGSLLEVGTGFHSELSGRENIYLNGAVLGMRKKEIDRKFDEIVDFSGVEKFLDTPVKRYSSGMRVRLAFSVAAHLDPEILLIDEVLSVGDAEFRKKSLGKMDEVARDGRTVLFVSHNMGAVGNLCSRTMLLENGKIVFSGNTNEVIASYLEKTIKNKSALVNFEKPMPTKLAYPISMSFEGADNKKKAVFKAGEPWIVELIFEVLKNIDNFRAAIGLIRHSDDIGIQTFWSKTVNLKPGKYSVKFKVNTQFTTSQLRISVGLSETLKNIHYVPEAALVTISEIPFDVELKVKTKGSGLLLGNETGEITPIT